MWIHASNPVEVVVVTLWGYMCRWHRHNRLQTEASCLVLSLMFWWQNWRLLCSVRESTRGDTHSRRWGLGMLIVSFVCLGGLFQQHHCWSHEDPSQFLGALFSKLARKQFFKRCERISHVFMTLGPYFLFLPVDQQAFHLKTWRNCDHGKLSNKNPWKRVMRHLQLLLVWGLGSSISSSCLQVSCIWQTLGFHGKASCTLQHNLLRHMARNAFSVVINVPL